MKWLKNICGDERNVKRFALFPIKANCEYRWLEFVNIHQTWNGEKWTNDWFVNNDDAQDTYTILTLEKMRRLLDESKDLIMSPKEYRIGYRNGIKRCIAILEGEYDVKHR